MRGGGRAGGERGRRAALRRRAQAGSSGRCRRRLPRARGLEAGASRAWGVPSGHARAGEGVVCSCAGGGSPRPGRRAAVGPLGLAPQRYRSDVQRYVGADSACRRVAAPSCACLCAYIYVHRCICMLMCMYMYTYMYLFGGCLAGICRKKLAGGTEWVSTWEQGRMGSKAVTSAAPGRGLLCR